MKTLVLIFIVLAGATSSDVYDPDVRGEPSAMLVDCTEEVSARFEWEIPTVPPALRNRAIVAASHWGLDRCYLPCDYEMCATIASYSNESVAVYVSYRFDPDPDVHVIGPEASVVFRLPDFSLQDEDMPHTGCRVRSGDCRPPGD